MANQDQFEQQPPIPKGYYLQKITEQADSLNLIVY
jgi:hypothetical protein